MQGSIPPGEGIEYDQREIVEVIQYAYDHGYRDRDGVLCQLPANGDLTQLRKAIWGFMGADRLTLNLTYYVNNTGDDTLNDGLTVATPFKTIQKAVNESQRYDPNGWTVTILVADGTYAPFQCGYGNLKGWGNVHIKGNITQPNLCLIQGVDQGIVFSGTSREYLFGGFKITNSGALPRYGNGLLCTNAHVKVYNLDFGACNMFHMWCSEGYLILAGMIDGVPNVSYPYLRVSGGAQWHMRASEGGAIGCRIPDMTILNPVTFAGGWLLAQYISHTIPVGDPFGSQPNYYNSLTGAANVTGKKYDISGNSVCYVGGGGPSYFPGTVAGTVSTGGQYI